MVRAGTVWAQAPELSRSVEAMGWMRSGAVIELVASKLAACSVETVAVRWPAKPSRSIWSGWSFVEAFTSFRYRTCSFALTVAE